MVKLLIACMRAIASWPLPVLRGLGWGLGMLLYVFAHARRHVVQVNLQHCFPDWSQAARARAVRLHFVQVGQSLVDRAWLWHAPLDVVRERLQWTGAVQQLAGEQPTVVFAPHFVGLDAGGLALTLHSETPVAFIYVTQSNPDLEAWVNQGRERGGPVKPYFRHDGVKQMVAALRQGEKLHLSPDMDLGPEDSVFVPFMGVTAATVTSLSRFARLGRAQVVPMLTRLTPEGYTIEVLPAWSDFPTADAVQDTVRMNEVLAQWVLQMPSQYYWVHKRFKTRPEGQAPLY
jgi:KDO2-lipid IV(A) lauroyltransferase